MRIAPYYRMLSTAIMSAAIFAQVSTAFAQGSSLSPYEAPITQPASFDDAIQNSEAERSRVTVINPVDDITVTAQVRGLGNVTVVFNREWRVPDVSYADNGFATLPLKRDGVHLQGYATYRGGNGANARAKVRVPAAATLFHSSSHSPKIEVVFLGEVKSGGGYYYTIKGELQGRRAAGALKVHRVSHHAFADRTCGLKANVQQLQSPGVRSLPLSTSNLTIKNLLSFDIATEADFDWVARYGTSSNTKIQSILNQVQTIYENQLNLTFNLTKQVLVSTAGLRYLSSNAETLLSSFQNYSENNNQLGNADVYHLFTGKDTFYVDEGTNNDSIIGLAYLGVVCAAPNFSYGMTEDLNDALNHITTAHEMGHNFNADHDAAGTIMGTVLNASNPPTQFSTASKNTIASFVAANSSCLSDGGASPTPGGGGGTDPGEGDTSHVSLAVSLKSNGTFSMTTGFSEVEAGCTAEVRAGSTAGRAYDGTLIATPSTDAASVTYGGVKVARNAFQYVSRSTRIQKVYIGVTKTCPSGTYYSPTKAIAPYKIRSSRARLKIGNWIKLLARQTLAATPG